MLYERWRQIARENRHEIALRDLTGGAQWTFAELSRAVESAPEERLSVMYPQGRSTEFIFTVLRAWRLGRAVCPLEAGQSAPVLAGLPGEIVHVKTTSATTAGPRLVAFTAEQMMADAAQIVSTMGLRPDSPNLGVISLAHSYGFSNLVLPLFLHGVPLFVTSSPWPETLRQAAINPGELTLAAVPALWQAWLDARVIPPNIRLAISAGAPLPLPLEEELFHGHGLKLHNFYGSSECGGIAYDRTSTPRTDASCAGSPMDSVELRKMEDGCLEVVSPAVGQTYWPEPGPELGRGRFRTRDLVDLEGGRVYLRGRVSDQINVAGRKISPDVIEQALLSHPEIRQCLVFGVPSGEAGRSEVIVACLDPRSRVSGEAAKQFLMTQLPDWQVPRVWWLVESLQADGRGKISRAEWREKYLAMHPRKPRAAQGR